MEGRDVPSPELSCLNLRTFGSINHSLIVTTSANADS